jgi:prepilin-type N-terminal cleavage/methylation domain-containing protein
MKKGERSTLNAQRPTSKAGISSFGVGRWMLDVGCSNGRGFTLIEVLSVMAIMTLLLAIALGSALGWGRSSGLRASVLNVKPSLALTRQLAVTHSVTTSFVFSNVVSPVACGYYVVTTNDLTAGFGETNYLPKGFVFDTSTWSRVDFMADGACTNASDPTVVIREIRSVNYLATTITVVRTTGFVRTTE